MATQQGDGSLDLEKELSCSICTEVLYQPLTLLDCLHTFCGSCLREWFTWQASNATTPSPYTCPSCRAAVRDTRPNATVTTLLDIFLRSHPDKGKSLEEKQEIARSYKPGDNVIPPVQIEHDSEESETERLLAEARDLSLQDMDPTRARQRRAAERARRTARHRGHEHTSRTARLSDRAEEMNRAQGPPSATTQDRGLEHQSSLRSLLSNSEIDSHEMQEDIMRQISEEGLLEGIDFNNLTPAQEEEITERIAQAWRTRQRQRASRPGHRRDTSRSPRPHAHASAPRSHHHTRSESASNQTSHERPPLSRPHLLDPSIDERRHRVRSSSQTSQRSTTSTRSQRTPSSEPNSVTPASRSATDLSLRPGTGQRERPRRISHDDRTATDPEGHAAAVESRRQASGGESFRDRSQLASQQVTSRPSTSSHVTGSQTADSLTALRSQDRPSNNSSPALVSSLNPRPHAEDELRPTSSSAALTTMSNLVNPFSEPPPDPTIDCSRCNKPGIQYSLHYHCSKCASGDFDLCLECYRSGKGCLHWFGFGYAAAVRYRRSEPVEGYTPGSDQPHVLSARRYRSRGNDRSQPAFDMGFKQRLEEGVFCEGCCVFADSCYWHCDICNEGAWGYCNDCVQQGKHCTHPLESLRRTMSKQGGEAQPMYFLSPQTNELYPAPLQRSLKGSDISETTHPAPGTMTLPNVPDPESYTPITISSQCNICRRPIPPSQTRYHCPTCHAGSYDIDTSCYNNLVASGKITSNNGPNGWRRCPRGHRMSIVGFEDREGGQRRVVVRDIVGGLALKEDDKASHSSDASASASWRWREEDGQARHHPSALINSVHQLPSQTNRTQRDDQQGIGLGMQGMYPPDGGVGLRVQALWSYFPAPEATDELSFPRGADIREVEDINGDWYWGVYAGRKGLFPGNFGRVVGGS